MEDDKLILKSGKEIYALGGIIGLSPRDEDYDGLWSPSYGYDGSLPSATYGDYFTEDDLEFEHLTKAEMLEICDIMIERWREFKDYVQLKREMVNANDQSP